MVVGVAVLVVVVHFSPKLFYISVWQKHTSKLQRSTANAKYAERRKNNNNAGSNASLPTSF
jgi:hypothetical protein